MAGHEPERQRRPRKKMIKTLCAAVLLFTVGSIMLWLGVLSLYSDFDRAVAMLVLGSIMFMPGLYACTVLYGAWQGWHNYRYGARSPPSTYLPS